ncbi:MJ0042 family finger-like domain-containing protein [Marinospirillum celere]|uniref:MJ0042 family finger-like domain-containing protein n=1 Tax=Marinospirillum celere TaxID=1122252 RepID=A0A1I1E256_9GAMM|nr:DUF3426 domain-containing protein [Marinospirillum celere]SFB81261.1 MJ0042 family finger-like domain-containing protein [Marinospirillum celere]
MHNKHGEQLTRCPHCDSVYEVSEEELELAYGAVRCGECMKIFNARFHKVNAPERTDQPAEEHSQTPFDPIPTLHDHYHAQDTDSLAQPAEEADSTLEEDFAAEEPMPEDEQDTELDLDQLAFAEDAEPSEREMDAELRAFEAELETALYDPDLAADEESASGDEAVAETGLVATLPDEDESEELVDESEELVTDQREVPANKKKGPALAFKDNPLFAKKYLAALAAVLLASIASLTAWLVFTPEASAIFIAEEVRISPSTSPQKMDIHFQLKNTSSTSQQLPDLQVDLLNLSRQVIATQEVSAQQIQTDTSEVPAASRISAKVEVDRPSTYVQNARIHPLTP